MMSNNEYHDFLNSFRKTRNNSGENREKQQQQQETKMDSTLVNGVTTKEETEQKVDEHLHFFNSFWTIASGVPALTVI